MVVPAVVGYTRPVVIAIRVFDPDITVTAVVIKAVAITVYQGRQGGCYFLHLAERLLG